MVAPPQLRASLSRTRGEMAWQELEEEHTAATKPETKIEEG